VLTTFLESGIDPIALVRYEEHGASPFRFAISRIQPSRDDIAKIFFETGCDPHNIVVRVSGGAIRSSALKFSLTQVRLTHGEHG
jgi:hypothetical protein